MYTIGRHGLVKVRTKISIGTTENTFSANM